MSGSAENRLFRVWLAAGYGWRLQGVAGGSRLPPHAAADDQLVLQQQGFGHDGAYSARAQEVGNGGQQVDSEYEQVNHRPGRYHDVGSSQDYSQPSLC